MILCWLVFLLYPCVCTGKPHYGISGPPSSPVWRPREQLSLLLDYPDLHNSFHLTKHAATTPVAGDRTAVKYLPEDFEGDALHWARRHRRDVHISRLPARFVLYWQTPPEHVYLWRFVVLAGFVALESLIIVWLLRARADRKRMEGALQSKEAELAQAAHEGEKRFRLMADSAPVLMWVSGTDKLRTDFNKEWLRFTGRTAQQESGDGWLQNVHSADLATFTEKFNQAFDNQQRFSAEYRLRRNDGRYRWVLDQGEPRFLENGNFAGYIGCAIDITDQKAAETVQAELGSRLIHAQEDERARIARELHDDINQRLALLANGIQELERAITTANRAKRKEDLRALWRLTSEISADIQYLSHQLHPSKLHYLGLAAAMRGLCQEFSTLHHIDVECVVRNIDANLDENVSLSLYRTAQESLRNVAKHSHAQHAKVELVGTDSEIRLRISDDGVGFLYDEATKGQGLGLVSMQERLRLVGGQFSVWSRLSLGTQVEGIVPIGVKLAQSA